MAKLYACEYVPHIKKAFGGLAMSRGNDRCSLNWGLPKVKDPLWKDHLNIYPGNKTLNAARHSKKQTGYASFYFKSLFQDYSMHW
jgi:muramidase (phage lysozyme)